MLIEFCTLIKIRDWREGKTGHSREKSRNWREVLRGSWWRPDREMDWGTGSLLASLCRREGGEHPPSPVIPTWWWVGGTCWRWRWTLTLQSRWEEVGEGSTENPGLLGVRVTWTASPSPVPSSVKWGKMNPPWEQRKKTRESGLCGLIPRKCYWWMVWRFLLIASAIIQLLSIYLMWLFV